MAVCHADSPDVVVQKLEIHRTDLLPGFELSLALLLEEADHSRQPEERES